MAKKKRFTASYLASARSGELLKRVEALRERLSPCRVCPRECKIDRFSAKNGYCKCGEEMLIASVCDHHGEEPPISGYRGSGAIFFGRCNLRCAFCQNHQISQPEGEGAFEELSPFELALRMISLQELGCHNINFVSPSHFVPQMAAAIAEAQKLGLKIPIVYNSNGYDSLETLKLLEGIVDIYMPDFKYAGDEQAKKYSDAEDYSLHAKAAITEMYRQVGTLKMDEQGVAYRGLIVRHLVLPNNLAGSAEALRFLAEEVGQDVFISLMSQYRPVFKAGKFRELSRKVRGNEYKPLRQLLEELGLENGYVQDLVEAPDFYLPDFDKEHPFEG
jgi:putative pyruvate formate lyase activating enzyme